MNNNNLSGEYTRQRSKTDSYSFNPQFQQQKYTPSSTYSSYQNSNLPTKFQPYIPKYQQAPKYIEINNKQKNKAMYYSTMNFSNNMDIGSGSSLNSFAREVNQDTYKNQIPKTTNFNNNDRTATLFNKYAGSLTPNNQSSNNKNNQFNRFPAFNLTNTQKAAQNISSSNQTTQSNPNQTPKQRRQRQIALIKKQADQIKKKLQNRPVPPINNLNINPQQNRPVRHQGISQSVIFDSNTSSSFHQDFGLPFKQHKTDNVSIQQLYTQKHPIKPSSVTTSSSQMPYQRNFINQPKMPTYNTYTNNTYQNKIQKQTKSYQPISTQFQYKPTEQSTYKFNSSNDNYLNNYKPSSLGNKQQTYGNSTTNKYTNNYMGYGQDKINKNTTYTYQKTNTPTYNYNNTSNNFSTQNKYDSYEKSSTPSFEKPSYNFSKTADSSEQTGFKKKKAYEVPNQQFQLKNNQFTKTLPTASTVQKTIQKKIESLTDMTKPSMSKIRRTDSLNYQEPIFPNNQQVKKFKITDFIIGKKMGKGQFGQVLLVRHKLTGWICGLKVMDKKDIRDQQYVQQIARELAIQFYLAHRNVAQLYGYFEDQTKFYLLIEFCTGGQLLEKLRGQKRMNQKDVSRIIRQVCEGIDYIHKQLIIHRDLKPENILFNYGTVKISDFGWAVYRGFGMRKTASGSPLYYPPEIVKGDQYDDKIDVWNIGMMTYECLLGKIPFRVYSQLDLGRIVTDQITFPSYVDVSDQAKDFILKTMKKKGQQRLQIRQMLRHPFLAKSQQNPVKQQIIDQFKKVLG